MILKISVGDVVLASYSLKNIDEAFDFINLGHREYYNTFGVKLWDETRCRENQQTTAGADSPGESSK